MDKRVVFISGIDTDIGKTIATGLLAESLRQCGENVTTQKLVQTGCTGISEDILRHREIMRIAPLDCDRSGVTCPYVFPEPCSPHLAARLAGQKIDPARLSSATALLLKDYDRVVLEGAGGLLVPLVDGFSALDYVAQEGLSVILVTSPRLGSINHTLSALEILQQRKIDICGVIYNLAGSHHPDITLDSREVFQKALLRTGGNIPLVDLYSLHEYQDNGRANGLAEQLQLR